VTEVPHRRHLLQGGSGVNVQVEVAASTEEERAALQQRLSTVASDGQLVVGSRVTKDMMQGFARLVVHACSGMRCSGVHPASSIPVPWGSGSCFLVHNSTEPSGGPTHYLLGFAEHLMFGWCARHAKLTPQHPVISQLASVKTIVVRLHYNHRI
jgi:hypothetical protein